MVVDILNGSQIKHGKEIIRFAPSGPPKGTGKHRYIFLLFSHDAKIGDNPAAQVQARGGFKIKEYADTNALGTPKALNFYYTENS